MRVYFQTNYSIILCFIYFDTFINELLNNTAFQDLKLYLMISCFKYKNIIGLINVTDRLLILKKNIIKDDIFNNHQHNYSIYS